MAILVIRGSHGRLLGVGIPRFWLAVANFLNIGLFKLSPRRLFVTFDLPLGGLANWTRAERQRVNAKIPGW